MNEFIISLDAIKHNYEVLRKASGAECAAVVKANAYGLGVAPVAKALVSSGCSTFFVSHVAEAAELRKILPNKIFILHGVQTKEEVAEVLSLNALPVLNNRFQADLWPKDKPCAVHFDTGMTRLGFDISEADFVKQYNLKLVMSHLSCAEVAEHRLNKIQFDEFAKVAALFPKVQKSLVNSAGISLSKDFHYDITRPGIALYGDNRFFKSDKIRNVLTVKSPILQITELSSNRDVGYSATYQAEKGDIVATIECGYADILFRSIGKRGKVFVNGHECPIIGRVSMDLITIKVNNLPAELRKLGQIVEILGDNYTISQMAEDSGTISYEILTKLGNRAKRTYA